MILRKCFGKQTAELFESADIVHLARITTRNKRRTPRDWNPARKTNCYWKICNGSTTFLAVSAEECEGVVFQTGLDKTHILGNYRLAVSVRQMTVKDTTPTRHRVIRRRASDSNLILSRVVRQKHKFFVLVSKLNAVRAADTLKRATTKAHLTASSLAIQEINQD